MKNLKSNSRKSWVLKHKKILKPDELIETIDAKYPELWNDYTQVKNCIKNEEVNNKVE